ncbi:MAG TPA: hypothetical protein EYH34_02905 [Planctomycetes bacterium]|nr:hypothetical protein [Planctomycetota bacterium]
MRSWLRSGALVLGVVLLSALGGFAGQQQEHEEVYPLAVLAFHERGADVKDYGAQVADILFAELATNPQLYLVDRQELDQILAEHALNLSGVVRPDQATQVGQLTGAKLLVTGSVFQVGKKLYLVAKVMGTETSRVAGTSVKGAADALGELAEKLAAQVAETIQKEANKLVPPRPKPVDLVAKIKEKIGRSRRPAVLIHISERHFGQPAVDPTARTELTLLAQQTGFETIDPEEGRASQAEVVIRGEGFSELAGQTGRLTTVKARVEVKAVDAHTGKIIAVDRQVAVAVDLSEQIAAKQALQQAAAEIALRLLPKITRPVKKRTR